NKIVEAVEIYAKSGNGYIGWGIGGGDMAGYNATNCAMGKTYLRILSGNIDVVGGEYIGDPGPVGETGEKNFPVRDSEFELCDHVTPETRAKYLGNDQFRTMSWRGFEKIDKHYKKMWNIPRPQMHQLLVTPVLCWDAILKEEPYPIKAIICWSSNPMIWAANVKHVYEALKAVELLVVVEYWKTPTAALADYIFPAADSLERPCATTLEDSCDFIIGGDRGSKPVGDRRMDYDFFRGLGMRLGQENDWPWETYEDVINYRVNRAGVTYEQFIEDGIIQPVQGMEFEKHKNRLPNGQIRGFATPSRKAEIFPSIIQELDYDPIPRYREPESPLSNPEMAKEYPMRLTVSGRRSPMYHSEMRVPGNGTRSQWPYPIVKVHTHDARALGLRDGDWTWIETPRGRIKQQAKLGWDIAQGTVQVAPSWWYPELPVEEPWLQGVFISNGNVLTDDAVETLDPGTGTWNNRGLLCRVYPAIDPADRSDEEISLADFMAGNTFFHKNYR
ncbi:MAG: molybdopterin-dependent oxidoreductase, partial [Sporomusaceae bacterium]|nr:molybdopterin-dependent oxidoreductase [Sporomusaceae bacterium]